MNEVGSHKRDSMKISFMLCLACALSCCGLLTQTLPANAGEARSWGENTQGQLGNNSTSSTNTPVIVVDSTGAALTGIVQVSSGKEHTVALRMDGSVWSWGANQHGQLGIGSQQYYSYAVPAVAPANSGIVAVSAGEAHTLALKADGTVIAWGNNYWGQLGDNTQTRRLAPVPVHNLSGVSAIAAGNVHNIALKVDGSIWGWGNNSRGQLGDGTHSNSRLTPVQTIGMNDIISIATGNGYGGWSMAVKSDGTAWAWGENENGQLGRGYTSYREPVAGQVLDPHDPSGYLREVKGLCGGGNAFSIALKADGAVWSWGNNYYGTLGIGTTGPRSLEPVRVIDDTGDDLANVKQISCGLDFALALQSNGLLWAWGRGEFGSLGNGSWVNQSRAVPVSIAAVEATATSPSSRHALAIVLP